MSHSETLEGLDSASQKHEKEIVIDLAPDRMLHFLGVYVIVLLAVITKVTEIAGNGRLSCFPINQNKSGITFIKHANAYCWESGEPHGIEAHQNIAASNMSACQKLIEDNKTDLISHKISHGSSSSVRRFLQWMPYGMLLEAFLFALPMAYWHFMVGARLTGHLKFMQLLLQDIYESVKTIPAGIYRKEPYDKDGLSLNCWRKYKQKNSNGRNQEKADTALGETQLQVSENPAGSTIREETASPSESAPGSEENHGASGEQNEQQAVSSTTRNTQEHLESKATSLSSTENLEKAKLLADSDEEVQNKTPTTSAKIQAVEIKMKKSMPKKKPKERTNQTKYSTEKFSEDKRVSKTQEHRSTETNSATSNKISGSDDSEGDNSDMKKVLQKVTHPNFQDEHEKLRKSRGSSNPNSEDEHETLQNMPGSSKGKGNGKLSDRHIFSMICYENFASLQHLPYLKSVEKLVAVPAFEKDVDLLKKGSEAILPMKYAILRKFCDAENFKSDFVVGVYKRKCCFSIALSSLITVAITMLFAFVILPTFWSGSALCGVPHHGQCLSCTLTGLIDVYAAFFANWLAVVIYLIVAVAQTKFVLNASDHALSHFFDDVKPLCGVALAAAHQVEQDKPKDSK